MEDRLPRIPLHLMVVQILVRLGSHFGNRYFDGLLDDVRIWGRPLTVAEVNKIWGNGMGDLGPNARIEMDNIAWSDKLEGQLILNQKVDDFNVSSDIQLNGLSLHSIAEDNGSNGTIYNLVLIRTLSTVEFVS